MASVETPQREFHAQARWVRTAPRKAQLVVSEIRGKSVVEAQTILAFMTRAAARDVEKVLTSAVANAESHPTDSYAGDQLYVSAAYVGSGPTLKRWRARARGRVGRIKKRTCHITIRLAPVEGAVTRPAPTEEARARARRQRAETPAPETAVEAPAEAAEEAPAEQSAAEEAPAVEVPAEETPAAEPKPKGTRARKPAPPEPGGAGESETVPAEAKPKRARSRKKAEEPATTEQNAGEEKED
jgi:large subunit ribosomal protein L22